MASAARNVAARSIHIKMHPTARSFSEQREVLRVLERFGEVEMFRSLKYDLTSPVPNAFISILATEAAAHAALEASPIRYRLIADRTAPPSSSSSPLDASSTASSIPPSLSSSVPPPESHFTLHLSPTPYPHQQIISSSPLHSSYTPVSVQKSPIASDLAQRIAPGIAKAGLVDWVTGNVGAFHHGGEGGGKETTKPWRLREKERRDREAEVPPVMRGLKTGVGLRGSEREGGRET